MTAIFSCCAICVLLQLVLLPTPGVQSVRHIALPPGTPGAPLPPTAATASCTVQPVSTHERRRTGAFVCLCSEEQWDARRHRRNLMPRRRDRYGNVKSPDAKNPFSLSRRYVYSDTKAYNELRRISFFVGPAFLVSSALFGVGNFAKEFPGYFKGEWSPALQDRFVNMPYLVRAMLLLKRELILRCHVCGFSGMRRVAVFMRADMLCKSFENV